MNLTTAILSVSSIDSKINLANSPKKIRDKDRWPTEHFLHVRVSAFDISGLATKSAEELAETNLDLVDIFICTFTEEDKMNWEAAFRVVGRGGMSPLAGCNIVADVSSADIVEGTTGDRHVMYTINVSTNSLRSASKSKGSSKELDQLTLSNESIDVTSMPPATWKVRRRYSQFLNLHNQLSVHFAAFDPQDVPKFPGKTYYRRRSFSSTHIGTRLAELRQYFVSILQFRIIRESSPLHRFLLDSNDAISTFLVSRLDPHWHLQDNGVDIVKHVKSRMEKHVKTVRKASIHRNIEAEDILDLI